MISCSQVAVIVNDMAELNIDAALVSGRKLVQTKEALVQLQVGGGRSRVGGMRLRTMPRQV